jgi:hypothetical protein
MAAIFIPERRAARASPFARRSVANLVGPLRVPPSDEWPNCHTPPLFKAAWCVIRSDLKLPAPKARLVMVESTIAAQCCVDALNYKAEQIARIRAQSAVHRACLTISRCINRAPAVLRKTLDQEIAPFIEQPVVDTETIECIFKTASVVFGQYLDDEPAQTARRLIEPFDPPLEDWSDPNISKYGAVRDYESLDSAGRHQAERALANLRNEHEGGRNITASAIFSALAQALGGNATKTDAKTARLIKSYVLSIAKIWCDAGLNVGRARREDAPAYKSNFHRYADLLLAAMYEPWSRRHDGNIGEISAQIWKHHAQLPHDEQGKISAKLPRADVQWLVSEDHVRAAARRLKFRP